MIYSAVDLYTAAIIDFELVQEGMAKGKLERTEDEKLFSEDLNTQYTTKVTY